MASDMPPVLVLGLGNTLLSDDGVGIAILEALRCESHHWGERVEFLDGGTQGLGLLGYVSHRSALILLDALSLGKAPGTVSVVEAPQLFQPGARRASTAHEGNASQLLAAAAVLGDLPQRVFVVGVEPQRLDIGIGLSEPVRSAVPKAAAQARAVIEEVLHLVRNTTTE